MNRGEVWWVERPEAERRPFLVLTRDQALPVLNEVIAVPATRVVRGLPIEVPLGPDDGMPTECVLSLDNLDLVAKVYFRERITRLSPDRLRQTCAALALAVGCE